jgi:guanine deaminase
MIISGLVMRTTDRAAVRLTPGWLRVEGPRIAEVHDGPCPHTPDLGGPGHIITPGFIDAHVHLPQADSIGVDGLPLLQWLERVIFPAEARWQDADFAGHMAARVARRLLAAGTTSVAAYATVHHQGAIAAMNALSEAGVSGWVGQVLMDQHAPQELCRPAEQLAHEITLAQPVGRIIPAITPRFAVSCSAELLTAAAKAAHELSRPIQTHLSETPDECELVKRLHGFDRYLDAYSRAGLLTARTLFAHGIHLDAIERSALAKVGATIAHCPTANVFLNSGVMDRAALRAGRIPLALGSDVAGGPDFSMPRVARAMIDAAKYRLLAGLVEPRHADIPTPAQAWHQITAGNAAALHLEDVGSLESGGFADLLVLKPGFDPASHPEPLGGTLYAWSESWVIATMSSGRVVHRV